MEKTFNYSFQVRGYELDSFGHVNNAVYINYMEQARWEIVNMTGLLKIFEITKSFLVVVETNIRYINEMKIFNNAYIETSMYREGFFIIFKQNIFLKDTNKKIAKASVKCVFIDSNRSPLDIPIEIKPYINE